MTQALHGSEKVREEMDELQAALAESEKINHCLNASYYKLVSEYVNTTEIEMMRMFFCKFSV